MHRTSRGAARGLVALSLVVLGSSAAPAQTAPTALVRAALSEVLDTLPRMYCDTPEVFSVKGDSGTAAQTLMKKLKERGWAVLEHGSTTTTYAVIADPDPQDRTAVAVGGLLLRQVSGAHVAFLTRCTLSDFGVPNDLYAHTPLGPSPQL